MSYLAALQLPTLPMSEAKLDYYALACFKKNIDIIVLGEYVLNSFFKELEQMPLSMIQEQSEHKISLLKKISQKYSLTIVAPIVRVKNKKVQKYIIKSTPTNVKYYPQYFLIDYKHWNEEKFFSQEKREYNLAVFNKDGIKYAIIFGFELYFDTVWAKIDSKKVDVVLLPSVSTFNSIQRWSEMVRMRAFTHNVYILRVNRVGAYKQQDGDWHFYGHSMLVCPNGEIEEFLDDKEAMMIVHVDKKRVQEARQMWGWRRQLQKKGLL